MPRLTSDVVPAAIFRDHPQPIIDGRDGLMLRPWQLADTVAVFDAYGDPAIQRWHVRAAASHAEVQSWIRAWFAGWSAGNAQWAVTGADDGLLWGRVALKSIDLGDGCGGVAYWTSPAHRGRGVASGAVAALTSWAFQTGFHRLELEHSVHNQSSCKVAVRAGFDLEGTKRSAELHADGWHDMHLHATIRHALE
ncbi:GNAT family N-acetyltransferase [Mycobacterium sp. BMJ-28]